METKYMARYKKMLSHLPPYLDLKREIPSIPRGKLLGAVDGEG